VSFYWGFYEEKVMKIRYLVVSLILSLSLSTNVFSASTLQGGEASVVKSVGLELNLEKYNLELSGGAMSSLVGSGPFESGSVEMSHDNTLAGSCWIYFMGYWIYIGGCAPYY
jgi:hypothetical protein